MTREAFKILTYAKNQAIIEENIDCDPATFALSQGDNDLPIALIASQLQSLLKAKSKLPAWYKARCILPWRAFEQASSEASASLKDYHGTTCLDLTAGLGIDSWHFSRHFKEVISVEKSPALAAITHPNFHKLNTLNANITAPDAKSFLQSYTGKRFDLLYIDPDRRDFNRITP